MRTETPGGGAASEDPSARAREGRPRLRAACACQAVGDVTVTCFLRERTGADLRLPLGEGGKGGRERSERGSLSAVGNLLVTFTADGRAVTPKCIQGVCRFYCNLERKRISVNTGVKITLSCGSVHFGGDTPIPGPLCDVGFLVREAPSCQEGTL